MCSEGETSYDIEPTARVEFQPRALPTKILANDDSNQDYKNIFKEIEEEAANVPYFSTPVNVSCTPSTADATERSRYAELDLDESPQLPQKTTTTESEIYD